MWESMMGKSIMAPPTRLDEFDARSLQQLFGLGNLLEACLDLLQHCSLGDFHLFEAGEHFGDAREGHGDDAIAVADDDIARADRPSTADDRQANSARAMPIRRIGTDANGIDRQVQ